MASEVDPDLTAALQDQIDPLAQEILLASSHHNTSTLRALLRDYDHGTSSAAANVRDAETGYSPLHAAIAGALDTGDDESTTGATNGGSVSHDPNVNGDAEGAEHDEGEVGETVQQAEKTMSLLLQNGAIWNSLDIRGETPGCLAWRVGLKRLYEVIVDAGVRSEILFQRLDEYEPLADDGSDDDEAEQGVVEAGEGDAVVMAEEGQNHDREEVPELVVEEGGGDGQENEKFLSSKLTFTKDRLLDDRDNGVMMEWERGIMAKTVDLLLPSHTEYAEDRDEEDQFTILNIGHGLGIIDTIFQQHPRLPNNSRHHIIEAHSTVLEQMKAENGFLATYPATTLHEGKWQDVLPGIAESGVQFDAIYFDTFAEAYSDFREFFSEWVIQLLKPSGRWSFFHGLGADRRVCYDVYTKVAEMDLFEAGFDVDWTNVDVPEADKEGTWEGTRRRYWDVGSYRLPLCQFMG